MQLKIKDLATILPYGNPEFLSANLINCSVYSPMFRS